MSDLHYFDSEADVMTYVYDELLASLRDDLNIMNTDGYDDHSDDERRDMENRIADIEAVVPRWIARSGKGAGDTLTLL